MVNGIFYDSNDLPSANDNAYLYNASYVTSYRLYNTFMLIRKLEFVTIIRLHDFGYQSTRNYVEEFSKQHVVTRKK